MELKVTSAMKNHAGRDGDRKTEFKRMRPGKRFWKR